jgi:hypothetical protein
MAAPTYTSRTLGIAAKRRQATPALAPVYASASIYHHEMCDSLAFRRPESTICTGGDR